MLPKLCHDPLVPITLPVSCVDVKAVTLTLEKVAVAREELLCAVTARPAVGVVSLRVIDGPSCVHFDPLEL